MHCIDKEYKLARLEKWKLIFRKLVPQIFEEKDPQILPIFIESLSTIGSNLFDELEVCVKIIYLTIVYNIFSNAFNNSLTV